MERPFPLTLRPSVFHARQIVAALGRRTAQLFREDGEPDATAARGVEAVFHGHVVVDDHRPHFHALSLAELGGHFEIHDVAGVVLDDVENARSTVDGARGGFDLIRSRRSEHGPGTSGVEHASAHVPHMHGFVTAASARHDAGLAGNGRVHPDHVNRIEADFQNIPMRQASPARNSAGTSWGSLINFFMRQNFSQCSTSESGRFSAWVTSAAGPMASRLITL
jgi:hypothetical protein